MLYCLLTAALDFDSLITMVGFEYFCPKTQARNLAPAGAILFQFQKFQNLVHDPQCFEPWKQEFLEKE